MGWPDTLIAAAAGVGGGLIGAYASLRATRQTLRSDTELKEKELAAAKDLSREEQEYQQRRDAYVEVKAYVAWAKHVNEVRTAVVDRRYRAVVEVGVENIQNLTAEAAAAMLAAYDDNGPTKWEQETIDGGPTPQERFRTFGLVDAFASEDVRDKFLQVVDNTEKIEKAQVSLEKALMDFQGSVGSEPASSTAAATTQQIESANNASLATKELLAATKQYHDAVASVDKMVRAELNRIRFNVEPSQS